jgi:bleomycin hydrolase
MKKSLIIVFLVFGSQLFASDNLLLIEQANKYYDESEYSLAVETYETIINNGFESDKLYYNLGNAYFKLNNLPMAIFYYEKASSGEMDAIIRATLHMVMEKEGGNFTENWKNTFNASLYRYLGETRINFNYEGKDYTPKSFAAQSGLKASDFVTLTSDDKSAMDTKITLTAKNNWNKSQAYNVNPDILVSVIQSAVNNGYCTIWYGSLPDEMIYNAEKVAIVPDGKIADLTQGDETDENSFNPLPEKTITNTERQAVLETSAKTEQNYLLISGISKDNNGTEYLIAKNVCEAGNQTLHLSSAFLKLNTGFIVVNKKGLPAGLNSKLGF